MHNEGDGDKSWVGKFAAGGVAAAIAIVGWAMSQESRIRTIETTQVERGPRIQHIEEMVATLQREITDPAPKPETRIKIESLDSDIESMGKRVDRAEERINALHMYLMQFAPPPKPRQALRP